VTSNHTKNLKMPAIGPYRWHRTPTPEPPSSYNPNDFLANMQGEANIIERFPTYGLSRTKLLEFMGTLFAENEYEISIHNDYYHIILPRKLSEAEAQALADLPDYLRGPRKKPEVTVSRDLSTTKKEATLAQDLGVPLIIPSDQGKLVIPVSYPKIHSSYEIVTSHVDLGSVHSSGYLYGARISYGITCEVYETTARWLWIGSEAVDNQTGHTFKVGSFQILTPSFNTCNLDMMLMCSAVSSEAPLRRHDFGATYARIQCSKHYQKEVPPKYCGTAKCLSIWR
jgi:hypothetical protein